MNNERYNQIIDEVYLYYLKTHKDEIFTLEEEIDLSKEEFIEKLKNNYSFGFLFGIQLNERKLTSLQIVNESETNTPTKLITLTYDNEIIEIYE